ncbi:hypothetical protein [Gallibacterium anatis]|uniref:hypothetical protein n=1 Tax=Gallibacterium anatis TaxID=750 RepID=UPI0039FC00DE
MELIKLFFSSVDKKQYIIAIIVSFVGLSLAIKPFFEFLLTIREVKFKNIDYALSILDKKNNEELKQLLEDRRFELAFYRITNVKRNIIFIKKISSFYKFTKGKYVFENIARATKYIKLENNYLIVDIRMSDRIEHYFLLVCAFMLFLYGIFMIQNGVLLLETNISSTIIIFIGIAYLCLACFLLMQAQTYRIALNLKEDIIQFNLKQQSNGISIPLLVRH